MAEASMRVLKRDDLFVATHSGATGCTWHIFLKTGSPNGDALSLCQRVDTEKLRRNHTKKPFTGTEEKPGLGKWCTLCKLAADNRLEKIDNTIR